MEDRIGEIIALIERTPLAPLEIKRQLIESLAVLRPSPPPPESLPTLNREDEAFIVRESIAIIESCLDGEYVVSYNGMRNALNDLRRLADRLAPLVPQSGQEQKKDEKAFYAGLIHQAIPDMAGTEPRPNIEEPTMQPHTEGADHWDCVCLDCQVSSRAERYPEVETPDGRMALLRSVVAHDIWPIDVDCLSVGEHAALKTATKILPALLRDLEYYRQVGSASVIEGEREHPEP